MGSERVRQSPGQSHFWRWKRDPTRTFAIRSVPHPAVETRHKLCIVRNTLIFLNGRASFPYFLERLERSVSISNTSRLR